MWRKTLAVSGNHFVQLSGQGSAQLTTSSSFNCLNLSSEAKIGFVYKLDKAEVTNFTSVVFLSADFSQNSSLRQKKELISSLLYLDGRFPVFFPLFSPNYNW